MSIFDTPHRNAMPEFQRSQTVLPAVAIQRIESNLLPELRVPNLILKKDEACRFVDKSYRIVETTTTHRVRHSGGISTPRNVGKCKADGNFAVAISFCIDDYIKKL